MTGWHVRHGGCTPEARHDTAALGLVLIVQPVTGRDRERIEHRWPNTPASAALILDRQGTRRIRAQRRARRHDGATGAASVVHGPGRDLLGFWTTDMPARFVTVDAPEVQCPHCHEEVTIDPRDVERQLAATRRTPGLSAIHVYGSTAV